MDDAHDRRAWANFWLWRARDRWPAVPGQVAPRLAVTPAVYAYLRGITRWCPPLDEW